MKPHSILDPVFPFHFRIVLPRCDQEWTGKAFELPETAKLPTFSELAGTKPFADVRAAWNEQGIFFTVRVEGKRQHLWCRESQPDESDGLHVWIDTRDTHNIHRASRFCHRFAYCPLGTGKAGVDPFGQMLPIHRAKEDPRTLKPQRLPVVAELRGRGYDLSLLVPAVTLSGFDPREQPRLGFFYAVIDRELGWQTWQLGSEFPVTEDPSLWGTLDLVPPGSDPAGV